MMKAALEQTTKATELVEKATRDGTIEHDDLAWRCEYTQQDAHLCAPDHLCIRSMTVAERMEPTGSSAILDIRMELDAVSDEVLLNTTVHMHVRDTFGMSQHAGQTQANGLFFVRGEDGQRGLHTRFPIEREVLDKLEADGLHSIHLILEDSVGEILDIVIGELRVSSC